MKLDITEALKEVQEKNESEIEYDTAVTWAKRAAACYSTADKAKTEEEMVHWLRKGDDFLHESLEHASLVKDYGKTVGEIQKALDKWKINGNGD